VTEPARPKLPRCRIEVLNPDDVLVLGVNETWFRTFTSSSDRYPLTLEVPPEALRQVERVAQRLRRDPWNVVTAAYTNVALAGKNEANVSYRVLLDEAEVVRVVYKAEVQPQTFTVQFKDSFHLAQRGVERGQAPGAARGSTRFQDLMKFQSPGGS
jgi:hypothetical protein